jgi:hypothetical protein
MSGRYRSLPSAFAVRVLESIETGVPYTDPRPDDAVSVAEMEIRLSGLGYAHFGAHGLEITPHGKAVLADWKKARFDWPVDEKVGELVYLRVPNLQPRKE